jgi:hypothetical protein
MPSFRRDLNAPEESPVSALPPMYLTGGGHHHGIQEMQARARNAPLERQRQRAVQEVQARCGAPVAQEARPQGQEQKGCPRRTTRLAAGAVRGAGMFTP